MAKSAFEQTGVDLPDPEPIEAPEPKPEPQVDRPSWLPSKFKDEGAFAESYRTLESRLEGLVRDKEEAEAYAQAMAEQLEIASQQTQPDAAADNPLVAQWEQAVEMGDARTQLALAAYVASQIADQKLAAQQKTDPAQEQANAGIFARVVDQDVQAAYEQKYREPWAEMRSQVGDFLAQNMHWLEGVNTPDEAARRIAQAADFVRAQNVPIGQEQAGNRVAQQKYLGQTLQGHGARTQAAQDAAGELVERMKALQGPYGYSS